MPSWVVGKIVDALNTQGRAVCNSKILVLGVAYKKNIDDMRESPSIEIIRVLLEKGATVEYSDPWIPHLEKDGLAGVVADSQVITAEKLASYDCVLIATDHDGVDYQFVQAYANCVVDARGVLQSRKFANVIAA